MRFEIYKDKDDVGEFTANYIIDRINAYAPGPGNHFVLGLPTGSVNHELKAALYIVS